MGLYFVSTEIPPVQTSWKPCCINIGRLGVIGFGPRCWISGLPDFRVKICNKYDHNARHQTEGHYGERNIMEGQIQITTEGHHGGRIMRRTREERMHKWRE